MTVTRVTATPGKEPNEWKVEHFANIGSSEEFIQQLIFETDSLIGAARMPEPERKNAKHAIMTISVEGFMPAFEHLKRIRDPATAKLPLLNRMQPYEDFTRVLWHGYKDLMPKAVAFLGVNIGFVFQNDTRFEKGLAEFLKAHAWVPPRFGDFLRAQRTTWQNPLAEFRNHYLEHRQGEQEIWADFYKPENSDALFDSAWRTTAEILFISIAKNFPPSVGLQEVPASERAAGYPRRFRFVLLGPV